ncbi:peptide/nickel transport system permease protein [Arthrobacter sp. cf158]|uniref:ABC transporter permease n=1 Tax=Arthrobacter sp. cf158 TaxID=1761744 RepID=UPI00089D6E6C|nr:ABC transporter permease [Arthrobacter sp. cf158]SDW90152.1 peptide/nickel transport system permease protein [Arthrobacter sp. cf158]
MAVVAAEAPGLVPARRRRPRRLELRVGIGLIAAVILACVVIPIVNTTDPNALVAAPLQPPSAQHPFGTDTVGRDVFIRVFTAGRLDLALAALGVIVPLVTGTVIGTVIGASRSRTLDVVAMRFTDGLIAFPFMIVVLLIVLILGPEAQIPPLPPGAASVLAATWLVNWTTYARLARARTHVLRQEDFIAATGLLGYSRPRIVVRHLLPSVSPTTATFAVADTLGIVALIAALPFLGAGIQPPTPEWGSIMYEGRGVLSQAWWISLSTVGVVLVLGTGVMMVVDSLISNTRRARLT